MFFLVIITVYSILVMIKRNVEAIKIPVRLFADFMRIQGLLKKKQFIKFKTSRNYVNT